MGKALAAARKLWPFRSNQLLYAGVLAGNAAWRAEVVPKVPRSTEAEQGEGPVARQGPRPARSCEGRLMTGMKARTRPTTANTFVKRDAKRGRDKLPHDAPLGWAAGPGPNC